MLAAVGMEGIPALVGIDMSGSVKMQIPIPGVGEWDPNTFTMGVWGGLIDKGKRAVEFAADGQWSRAIEAGAPTGLEMMMKSTRLAREGLRTAAGRPILDEKGRPIAPTAYETGVQIAGFRPKRISEIQKERHIAENIKEKYSKQRDKIRKHLRSATTQEEIQQIQRDIQTYNMSIMKYRGVIPRIDKTSIRQAFMPERGYSRYEQMMEGE
jgi:hypothetical protein